MSGGFTHLVLGHVLAQLLAATSKTFHEAVGAYFNTDDPGDFKQVISYACTYFDISVGELADEFGASVATVNRWVAGSSAPARHSRRRIAERIAELVIAKSPQRDPEHVVNLDDPSSIAKFSKRAKKKARAA
ncbi:MAG: hypothetical protein QE276_12490 [Cyanobium sp. D14.bin.5]|nr:hypothetical protein [Cyanobium sp. D14.bin.5]